MSKWVQSKYSKDAKKWEVLDQHGGYYHIKNKGLTNILLEDEYVPCDPPERWETCTREVVNIQCPIFSWKTHYKICLNKGGGEAIVGDGLRWAWSEKDPDALVIQKRTVAS